MFFLTPNQSFNTIQVHKTSFKGLFVNLTNFILPYLNFLNIGTVFLL